ncbi:hypothetical protein DMA11_13295 [Marinilabiliaceae bacterium JC017]|nr:hypothetical protein DMA11_13295 [Marinilabiliaceae bacterium JC017]
METKGKTIALISYITFIGWIIALILRQNERPQSELSRYHLRQAFGIQVLAYVGSWVLGWIAVWFNFFFIVRIFGILVFVLWLIGLINAIKGEIKPIPFVGDFFEENLTFIK